MAQEAKPQSQRFGMVDRDTGEGSWIYREVADLVRKHHEHLGEATIWCAWKHNWSEDVDGNSPLGKTVLTAEVTWRAMAEYLDVESPPDFVLVLNAKLWQRLDEAKRRYVLDELLCYCGQKLGRGGDQVVDVTGRRVWMLHKPEHVGFAAPIARHGALFAGTKAFLTEASGGMQRTLFDLVQAGTEEEEAEAEGEEPEAERRAS